MQIHVDNFNDNSTTLAEHPIVQAWVHDQMMEDYYRYTILILYIFAGLTGMTTMWVIMTYIKWLSDPLILDF